MNFKTYFKDLIDPSIIAGVLVILAVTVIVTLLFSSKVGSFKQKYKSKFLVYLLIIMLIDTLVTFMGSSEVFDNKIFNIFIFYQILFFILGMIHCYIYRNHFQKFEQKSPWIEILFSLIIVLYCLIPLIIVYTIIKGNLYVYDMVFSTLMFIIPTLIYLTFEAAISIEPKVFKTWQFPEEHAFPDLPVSEFRDILMVTLVFYKGENSDIRTEFTIKAPIRVDFGRLFYHFVNDYNIRNPDSPIPLKDHNGDRQHWVFLLKSKTFGFLNRFIRPERPVYMNLMKENSIVICRRTLPEINSEAEMIEEMKKQEEENTKEETKSNKENNSNF